MNILTTPLPKKIKIKNRVYDIRYDYRTIINILLAFEDEELTYNEKIYVMIKNLYVDNIPDEDYEEACLKAIKFIDLNREETSTPKDSKRIYSFTKDGNYIFTGINSTHHIDLEKEENLHWWKFMAMFMDMNSDCMFGEITYYRKRKLEGKLTKEEKKNYEKIKDMIDLEETKKPSEAKKKFFEEFHKSNK